MAKFKTNLHQQFQVDEKREEAGFWYDVTDTISIQIRRISSKASQDARKKAEEPYTVQLRAKKIPEEVLEDIAAKQLAFGVIANWKGITGEDGEEIPYSGENAYDFLSDPSMKEFAAEIFQQSLAKENFKAIADEDAVKN